MPSRGQIRVYIADDHPIYRQGLSQVFSDDPAFELIGTSASGDQAFKDLVEIGTDVVALLDIHMPGRSGIEIIRDLRREGITREKVRAILLTGSEEHLVIQGALAAGTCGYLLKTIDWDDLKVYVARVADGEIALSDEVLGLIAEEPGIGLPDLTPRETEVLRLAAQGLSYADIGKELSLARATIKTHLSHVYEKWGVKSMTQAVAIAIRRGLLR